MTPPAFGEWSLESPPLSCWDTDDRPGLPGAKAHVFLLPHVAQIPLSCTCPSNSGSHVQTEFHDGHLWAPPTSWSECTPKSPGMRVQIPGLLRDLGQVPPALRLSGLEFPLLKSEELY